MGWFEENAPKAGGWFEKNAPSAVPQEEVSGEMHPKLELLERWKIQNAAPSPESAVKYLQTKGWESKLHEGEVVLRLPGEKKWFRVDETGFSLKDLGDIGDEVVSGVATGAGAAGGALLAAPTGPGAIAAGAGGAAAGSAAAEAARRGVGAALGFEQTLGEAAKGVGEEALWGAGAELGAKAIGKGLKAAKPLLAKIPGAKAAQRMFGGPGGVTAGIGRTLQAPARFPAWAMEKALGERGTGKLKSAAQDALIKLYESPEKEIIDVGGKKILRKNMVAQLRNKIPGVGEKEAEALASKARAPFMTSKELGKMGQRASPAVFQTAQEGANLLTRQLSDLESTLKAAKGSLGAEAYSKFMAKVKATKDLLKPSTSKGRTLRLENVQRAYRVFEKLRKDSEKLITLGIPKPGQKAAQRLRKVGKGLGTGTALHDRSIKEAEIIGAKAFSKPITEVARKAVKPDNPFLGLLGSLGAGLGRAAPAVGAGAKAFGAGGVLPTLGAGAVGLQVVGLALERLARVPAYQKIAAAIAKMPANRASSYLYALSKTDPRIREIVNQQ